MRTRTPRRILRGALLLALILPLLAMGGSAHAEGNEQIGPAQLPLASSTGIAFGGTSLLSQPAALTVEVPERARIDQVIVHWVGLHHNDGDADGTATIDGNAVEGVLIGGPVLYSWKWRTSSYRADITQLGLVQPGANTLTVTDVDFPIRSDGMSITVLYTERGQEPLSIDLRDGADVVIAGRPGLQKTSVRQTYTVPSADAARQARLLLAVADADDVRPQDVLVSIDGVETSYPSLLGNEGHFAAVVLEVEVPVGVNEIEVEVRSLADPERPDVKPSSMVWIVGGIAADPPPPTCTFFPPTAEGHAFALNIAAAPLVGPQGPYADTRDTNPAGPLVDLDLSPLPANIGLLSAFNDLDIAPDRAVDHALAAVGKTVITLGDHTISADTIIASSVSQATQQSATSSGDGSRIQNLVINGTTYGDITSEQVIELGGAPFPLLRVTALATTATGAAAAEPQPAGGRHASSLAVDGLRVELLFPDQANALDVDIVLAHAESSAEVDEPVGNGCPDGSALYGRAFVVSVEEQPSNAANVVSSEVLLPSVGGSVETTTVDLTTLGGSATGSASTVGRPNVPRVESKASVENLDLFNRGAVIADVINARVVSTAGGETGEATIAGLVIGGTDVCAALGLAPVCSPAPNTVLELPGIGHVVLNEQIPSPDGLVVNAVHLRVLSAFDPAFPTGLDVVIASAEGDATR